MRLGASDPVVLLGGGAAPLGASEAVGSDIFKPSWVVSSCGGVGGKYPSTAMGVVRGGEAEEGDSEEGRKVGSGKGGDGPYIHDRRPRRRRAVRGGHGEGQDENPKWKVPSNVPD